MKKETDSENGPKATTPAPAIRSTACPQPRRETVEEAIERTRNMPSFLEEIGPEAIAQFIREAAKHDEVMGFLPPIKQQKQKKKRR